MCRKQNNVKTDKYLIAITERNMGSKFTNINKLFELIL